MALDGLAVCALSYELNASLAGGKIDKIYQPERDEVVITVRRYKEQYRLLLCANPSFPRVHFIETAKDNPASPPMFCMLLRKHLLGGKILGVYQQAFERILKFEIESFDELGERSVKTLILEIMGKHSNLILVSAEGTIIDSIFHVDITVSSVRQVLPGLPYALPPSHGKLNPLLVGKSTIASGFLPDGNSFCKQLMDRFMGISPVIGREAVFRALGDVDAHPGNGGADAVADAFFELMQQVKDRRFSPVILHDREKNKPLDVSAVAITQYGSLADVQPMETINAALEQFYRKKASAESVRQRTADLLKVVTNHLDRCRRKLQMENETLEKAKKRDLYKIKGDLITANLYRIKQGDAHAVLENFYSEGELLEIALAPDLTPAQNAQRYYSKYNKEKTAEAETRLQREKNLLEIDYLESVQQALEGAGTREEILQIRDELTEQGYLKNRDKNKRKKPQAPKPMQFVSSDGFEIYAGKNNKQNDYITLKLARSNDIWLHTKNIHGSHVIIKTGGADVPETTLREAAMIAAYYSKGRQSSNVPVDYTEIKHVKKPSGAKPGMVIYVNNSTAVVTPDEQTVLSLAK